MEYLSRLNKCEVVHSEEVYSLSPSSNLLSDQMWKIEVGRVFSENDKRLESFKTFNK